MQIKNYYSCMIYIYIYFINIFKKIWRIGRTPNGERVSNIVSRRGGLLLSNPQPLHPVDYTILYGGGVSAAHAVIVLDGCSTKVDHYDRPMGAPIYRHDCVVNWPIGLIAIGKGTISL